MARFVNRNVRNKWEKICVDDPELVEITKKNFLANMSMVIKCIKNVPKILKTSKELEGVEVTQPMIENAIAVLSDRMTTPLIYDVETYVDEMLAKKTSDL
jgi:hypothetical protein